MAYEKKMHSKSSYHENEFKPASGQQTIIKSAFEYVEQKTMIEKKRKLDENGRVKTQPRNITSNPTDKVERQFMKNPEYISDPFDRKKEQ